ncbi:MAG: hypothetical protein Q7T26_06700 [Dehalococcoidia bacterium]|nr:hypothetical protein [Dehalococcoidia bacterium]
MKVFLVFALVAITVLAAACSQPAPAPSPVPPATQPPAPTAAATQPPAPAATPLPAATAAPTSIPTASPTSAPSAAEARSELKLVVSQPENESVVSAPTVTVKGATSPDAVVSVNGALATIAADGTFSQDVALQPGPNRIEVLASTFDGQSKSQVINLIRMAS